MSAFSDAPHRDHAPSWRADLRGLAEQEGFIDWGVTPVVTAHGFSKLVEWIERGYAAGMDYFADRLDAYRHPHGVMPGAKSIIVLAFPYPADVSGDPGRDRGRVARYAWPGQDYHDTIHRKLKRLRVWLRDRAPEVRSRGCVDTAPLLERELAQRAGLGWRGKNTLLLDRQLGSYFFLACLLVDVELPYDRPHEQDFCGSCTACLDACPTAAFPQPGVLDAGRCISYLTIEHRGAIPESLREPIGDWLFGCDVCQEVCPWNRKPSRRSQTLDEQAPLRDLALTQWFEMDEAEFRRQYRKTPLWRTRLNGMRRNAAIVLGNRGDRAALPLLRRFAHDEDAVVAEACRWAIERIQVVAATIEPTSDGG